MHDQYAIIPPEDQQTDSEIERRRPDANDSEISPIVSRILFRINFKLTKQSSNSIAIFFLF